MTQPAFCRDGWNLSRISAFLRRELAPQPGRMDSVWRYLVVSAIVITVSLALQIPMLGLSLVIVFFTAQDNATLTLTTCAFSVVGTTVAIGATLILVQWTMGYPLVRLLGASLILFGSIYFMRISKLGQMGWLTALTVAYTMTLLDVLDNPEAITRILLWVWVAIAYPILVTALTNLLMLPAHPVRQLKDELLRQLEEVDRQLEARRNGEAAPTLSLDRIEQGITALKRYLGYSIQSSDQYRKERGFHLLQGNTVDRLFTSAAQLSRIPPAAPTAAQRGRIDRLRAACRDLRRVVQGRETFTLDSELVGDALPDGPVDTILQEMAHALNALAEAESLPHATGEQATEGLIAQDWLSNPVYAQFALKTLLAAAICYVFQAAVQWQGIHTAPLTCIIVALPSLGASSRKGIQRAVGCGLGSLVTLAITVFVIPHLESLPGLLLLTLPIIAIGAWIAAGSVRTSYIGVQFVFAFSLALFGHFGPDTNIPEIRDRMVGILAGLGVATVVHLLVWPEREGSELWSRLAQLVRSIAGLARAGNDQEREAAKMEEIGRARQTGWSLLTANREMESRVALEPGWQYAHGAVTVDLQTWFAQVQEALFSVNWLQTVLHHAGPELQAPLLRSCDAFREHAARRLEQLAEQLQNPTRDLDPVSLESALADFERQWQTPGTDPDPRRLDEIAEAVRSVHERIAQLSLHLSNPVRIPAESL
jgi:multidrug resistance protein MdtO